MLTRQKKKKGKKIWGGLEGRTSSSVDEQNLLEEKLIGIEINIEECYVNNIFTNKF